MSYHLPKQQLWRHRRFSAEIRLENQEDRPVEVGHEGADISSRVLLGVLPLALPDVIDVAPEPLGPIKVARIIHRVYLA